MRTIAFLILAASALSACGIDKPDGTLEGKVRFVAQTANLVAGAMDSGNEIRAIEAEGRTLVLKLNLDQNIEGPITAADILEEVRPEVCSNENFTKLLNEGAAVRIVFYTPDGKSLPPATFTQCPAASAGPA